MDYEVKKKEENGISGVDARTYAKVKKKARRTSRPSRRRKVVVER